MSGIMCEAALVWTLIGPQCFSSESLSFGFEASSAAAKSYLV